ncbi:PREDICTED: uridine 5'-monophosphate synthase-like [Branchiostoma belcheri]|uniref:Uridine 5'-monophosphate synthase n=1 Tax=Branchiostoma belcheri TaxID=7741 RepID=A0A6P5A0I9_BRABE|nr:PREDICTED: uridine 5'-monophosphate synthase-like [Branchiostoma belcheri]
MSDRVEQLILDLFAIEAVKFGDFTLKSGIQSPIYFDLRVIVSYPVIMNEVAELLWETTKKSGAKFATVCGVPYTALPLATLMSAHHDVPMLIRRKEAKDYGTKKMIEGKFEIGSRCLIVEDVVTSGSSVKETAQVLESVGLVVTDAVVLLDREQGGKQKLKEAGIELKGICGTAQLLEILRRHEKIPESVAEQVRDFVRNNSFLPGLEPPVKKSRKVLSYRERGDLCQHPVARQLFSIMEKKKSNLAVSADLCTAEQVLQLADQVGPHICMLKTHADIMTDFSTEFVQSLTELADRHQFIIFEDRKFADIGSTVQHQYRDGLYHIADWAHLTNAHALPGSGVLEGLKQVGLDKKRACLLIAEMSSKGNLATGDYTKATVKMAEEHKDFVVGFISQSQLTEDPTFIHMTPGVQLSGSGDGLGQQYVSPWDAVVTRRADVIIVGRGVYKDPDPASAAQRYQTAAFEAYQHRLAN